MILRGIYDKCLRAPPKRHRSLGMEDLSHLVPPWISPPTLSRLPFIVHRDQEIIIRIAATPAAISMFIAHISAKQSCPKVRNRQALTWKFGRLVIRLEALGELGFKFVFIWKLHTFLFLLLIPIVKNYIKLCIHFMSCI